MRSRQISDSPLGIGSQTELNAIGADNRCTCLFQLPLSVVSLELQIEQHLALTYPSILYLFSVRVLSAKQLHHQRGIDAGAHISEPRQTHKCP